MATTGDTPRLVWRKSVHSDAGHGCVELARFPGQVGVRDSKDTGGPTLSFTCAQARALGVRIKDGELDL
ncbi:DUF397 domain-containing protein [Spirillospora sp. NPDC052269]